MDTLKENLNFDTFRQLVVKDYCRTYFFNKVVEQKCFRSFSQHSLLLSVLSKYTQKNDMVFNIPLPCMFSNFDEDKFYQKISEDCMVIGAETIANSNDYQNNISVLKGMVYAISQTNGSNSEPLIVAGISMKDFSEIDMLNMLETLGEVKLPANVILLDIEKAKGDFLRAKEYFDSKNPDKVKADVIDVANYELINSKFQQGAIISRTTNTPVLYYPKSFSDNSDYLSQNKDPLTEFRNWIIKHNLENENKIADIELEIDSLDIFKGQDVVLKNNQ